MTSRIVVTGAGGFIGSYLVPLLEEDGLSVVRAKYSNGNFIFTPNLREGETVILLNLAAATTKSANNFSIGYDLSVAMVEKLHDFFVKASITVHKTIQFSSFGELHAVHRKGRIVFHREFKNTGRALDNYQYWKICQRVALLRYFKSVLFLAIPLVSSCSSFMEIGNSPEFNGLRRDRIVLVTRLKDICSATKHLLLSEDTEGIHFPELRLIKIKGDYSFIKSTLLALSGFLVRRDKKMVERVFYRILSQAIEEERMV